MAQGIFVRRQMWGRAITPYAFALPPLIYISIILFWPVGRELWISLTDTKITNPNQGDFIGLANYHRLFSDPDFFKALWITVLYTAGSVLYGVSMGVVSALAIDRPFRFRAIARAILLFGWAVPGVAAVLIWLWMYNEQSGVLNEIFIAIGVGRIRWLTSMDFALTSIFVVTIWHVAPFVMLVILAALQSVPEEVREAARVDGADPLNVFWAVTLPHILPFIQLVALIVAVWSIRRFELIYLLTGGGPLGSTGTLVVKLRQVAFESYDMGLAGAYGAVGIVLALIVGAVHFFLEKRRTERRA